MRISDWSSDVCSSDLGEALGGRILGGINVQDRYRGKIKRSDRYSDPSMEELVSWEDQEEIKDGRDYSGNVSYTADVGETGRFSIDGFYVKTDREVTEVSFEEEYDDGETITADVPGFSTVDQQNWGIGAESRFDMAGGTTEIDLGSEEHTSELQSLMRISYAVFCLKKKTKRRPIRKWT